MTIPRRSSRRNYDRVSDGNGGDIESTTNSSSSRRNNNRTGLNEPLSPSHDEGSTSGGSTSSSRVVVSASTTPSTPRTPLVSSTTTTTTTTQPPIYNQINIIVLDAAQTKFNIPCDSSWTVSDFKTVSASVHKIVPKSQRLIYMGKLLSDDAKTLKEYGIEEDGKIVHLFPKPNIVMVTPSASSVEGNEENEVGSGAGAPRRMNSNSSGAHVPQIILDAEEANRQTQIRILSSHEIFEAQNRVKLLSFLLLIVCSMELLTLFTIFLGVPTEAPVDGSHSGYDDDGIPPGDPTDTNPHSGSGGNDDFEVRTWRQSDYADLCISFFGFYVATLGIKATTENTLTLARQYFFCLVVVGVAWSAYCFYVNVKAQEDAMERNNDSNGDNGEDSNEEMNGDIYANAMFATMLPLFVWIVCFLRAWQFQTLIQEAEREAEERLGGLTAGDGEDQEDEAFTANPSTGGADLEGGNANLNVSSSPNNAGDLELIVEQREIT